MRLAFFGTPGFAVPTLAELIGQGHEIAAVYTRAPRPAGRGQQPHASPVEAFARLHGLDVRTPATLRTAEEAAAYAALNLDAAIVVAYGLILPKAILDAPRLGCFNVHASLLPRWRGAAPIQRAILAGDKETGVSIMRMEEGLDTGPVLLVERIAIGAMTAGELHDRLAELGASLMVRALGALERGTIQAVPQPAEGVTYAAKIDKSEARIDWARPASEVARQVQALSPSPGAWFEVGREGAPVRVRVLRARATDGAADPGIIASATPLLVGCGSGALELMVVQRAGAKAVSADDFLRGFPLRAGTRLG